MGIKRRFQLDGFAGTGMLEGQPPGMEKLALEAEDILLAAINRVADNGAFEPGQVNPDLVGPARFQADFQQAVSAKILDDPVVGAGGLAVGPGSDFLAKAGIAAQGDVNDAFGRFGPAKNQGQVNLLDRSGLELLLQLAQRGRGPSDNHQPGGIPVQPVDDAGPVGCAGVILHQAGQIRVAGQQGIDQGAAGMPLRRVNDHPGRLVDDDQIVIFVNNVERRRLRLESSGFGRGQVNGDDIAGLEGSTGSSRLAGDQDLALANQFL